MFQHWLDPTKSIKKQVKSKFSCISWNILYRVYIKVLINSFAPVLFVTPDLFQFQLLCYSLVVEREKRSCHTLESFVCETCSCESLKKKEKKFKGESC